MCATLQSGSWLTFYTRPFSYFAAGQVIIASWLAMMVELTKSKRGHVSLFSSFAQSVLY